MNFFFQNRPPWVKPCQFINPDDNQFEVISSQNICEILLDILRNMDKNGARILKKESLYFDGKVCSHQTYKINLKFTLSYFITNFVWISAMKYCYYYTLIHYESSFPFFYHYLNTSVVVFTSLVMEFVCCIHMMIAIEHS